jgi:hypothetical protein
MAQALAMLERAPVVRAEEARHLLVPHTFPHTTAAARDEVVDTIDDLVKSMPLFVVHKTRDDEEREYYAQTNAARAFFGQKPFELPERLRLPPDEE